MIKSTVLLTLISFCSIACINQYDIKEVKGNTYRINRYTGEVALIVGKSIFPMKTFSDSSKWTPENAGRLEELEKKRESGLLAGTVKSGYFFKGGDQFDSADWTPVKAILDTLTWKPGQTKKVGKYDVYLHFPWDSTSKKRDVIVYTSDPKTGKLIRTSKP